MASGRKCSISFSLFHFNFPHIPLERVVGLRAGDEAQTPFLHRKTHLTEGRYLDKQFIDEFHLIRREGQSFLIAACY